MLPYLDYTLMNAASGPTGPRRQPVRGGRPLQRRPYTAVKRWSIPRMLHLRLASVARSPR